jgi:hypothetical protein
MNASRTIALAALLGAAIPTPTPALAQVSARGAVRASRPGLVTSPRQHHQRHSVRNAMTQQRPMTGCPMTGREGEATRLPPQRMRTMRGMGWMRAGPMMPGMRSGPLPGPGETKPLPEPGSPGATFVATFCTQCHAAPSPTLHSAAEWGSVTHRMQLHMSTGPSSVKSPSQEEMQTILAYLQRHAR